MKKWIREMFDKRLAELPSIPAGTRSVVVADVGEKICISCDASKPVDDFYKHPQMSDGRLGKCKTCCKRDNTKNRSDNLEHYQEYDRKRDLAPERMAVKQKATSKQRVIHPDRYTARTAVSNALRDGRLVKLPCRVCKSVKSEAHHDDYSKPLEVDWLCRKCHRKLHKAVELMAA